MRTASRPPSIGNAEREQRLDKLRRMMPENGVDALIITPGSNMRYFFGEAFYESERFVGVLITAHRAIFICPKFEESAIRAKFPLISEMAFWEEHESPFSLIASLLADQGCQRCVLDPDCSYGHAAHLFDALAQLKQPILYDSAAPIIASLRATKSSHEIDLMIAAMQLTLSVHQTVFEWIKPGMKASAVIAEIDRLHRAGGADGGNSFCAVQFGEATSHPHGVPGDPALQQGELILIDTGCTVDGYNSDITRTYALSKMDDEIERLWCVEKEAQQVAFACAAIGTPCEAVDKAARDVLIRHGLGPGYDLPGLPHRTGHGIGLDIHEDPYLVKGDKTPLAPGMCFSNEPMIVVSGQFGIRLEDHFYMTASGPEWFTQPQHDLYRPFG
ncbi:Xaa-Pro peptidase family protein [Parasphingorhabdus sp.]|uniref:M24 family metallopeptidase n=1 Tax=Parasphingorhabdus sp. TaxID=2709688 RepID=UPI0030B7435C|nr:aminopeptidase P family protein [Sphingomonadales bacterium]